MIPDGDLAAALTPVKIFCSYRRVDNDDIFKNTIDHLVADMKALHEAETGRPLDVFFDREELGWGDNFREAIDQAVREATFFMPIITARYFDSEWCRHEFLSFYSKSRSLGVTELILPIVLAGISHVRTDSTDRIAATIAEIQYSDWSNLWQEGRESSIWRINVTRLVRRIVDLRSTIEMQLADQTLSESRLNSCDQENSGMANADHERQVAASGTHLMTRGYSSIDEAERVVSDVSDFFLGLDRAIRTSTVDARLAHAALSAEFTPRAHSLERAARDMLTDILDFDTMLRSRIRAMKSNQEQEQLKEIVRTIQNRATAVENRINDLVYAPTLIRRLDSTLGLRPVASSARAVMQTIRDLLQFLYGWITLEV